MIAEGAVRAAELGIVARYRSSRRPLLTAAERRAASLVAVGSTLG